MDESWLYSTDKETVELYCNLLLNNGMPLSEIEKKIEISYFKVVSYENNYITLNEGLYLKTNGGSYFWVPYLLPLPKI